MALDWEPAVPDGARESQRYADYFRRKGLTKQSILDSVQLTYERSNVYFDTVYDYFEQTGKFDIACKKGCAFCCHTMVSVVPPEAFFLANHIETAFDRETSRKMIDRIIAHDAEHRTKSGAERHVGRIACPMLDPDTWLCTVHKARPLTCRAMHSGDLKPCQVAFETRDAYHGAPSHSMFFANTQAYYDAYGASLTQRGVVIEPLELNAALATIWTGEKVFLRWLRGEDPFYEARADHGLKDAAPRD